MRLFHLKLIVFQKKTLKSTILQLNVIDRVRKMNPIMIQKIGILLQPCPFYYPRIDL